MFSSKHLLFQCERAAASKCCTHNNDTNCFCIKYSSIKHTLMPIIGHNSSYAN